MYRGRFAPTPSGDLHLGSLVAATAGFLDARVSGGQWLVRIEDVDVQRCKPHFESSILTDLERHGLNWDGEVVRQSSRTKLYEDALKKLYSSGHAYSCFCSRAKLEKMHCRRNAEGEFVYPAICRPERIEGGRDLLDFATRKHSFRFRADVPPTLFNDEWLGPQSVRVAEEAGDFVLRRTDGCFAYTLAVVVDDFLQGITHIVRGMDILPLTARQIQLQKALGFDTPVYRHCRLVCGPDGQKLSKSASARALRETPAHLNLSNALKLLDVDLGQLVGAPVLEQLSYAMSVWRPKMKIS
jgi:glutamyl-Q tRNA(Asp) synthetase